MIRHLFTALQQLRPRPGKRPGTWSPGAALLTSVLILTGCGRQPATTERAARPAEAEQKVVSLLTFDEYHPQELLDEFKARTGLTVEMHFYEDTDEMVELLKSYPGKFDVFVCEDGYVPILAGKRMMRKLDHSRITNWKNLDPDRLDQPFDPKNEFTVPYLWGTTLIAYRKDMLPDPKRSWSLVFEPAVKDKLSFMNERMECYAAMLRTMGQDLPTANQEAIRQAADSMVSLIRDHGLRMGSEKDVKQHLLEGSSALAMMYSGDAARLAAENPDVPLGYFIPDEGATVWTDSFCISRDTTRPDQAYLLIDFMTEGKSAGASSNFAHYASPNLQAAKYIEPELLKDETINPRPEVLSKCRYFKLRDVDSQKMVNAGWRLVQNAWLERSGLTGAAMPENPAADAGEEEEEEAEPAAQGGTGTGNAEAAGS